MFSLDEKFIEDLGINNQPEDVQQTLIAGIEKTIQDRVLLNLSGQLTDFLVGEIEAIGESTEKAAEWLDKNIPHYAGSAEFALLRDQLGESAVQSFAQAKWFEMNLPNWAQQVATVTEQVKQELLAVKGE